MPSKIFSTAQWLSSLKDDREDFLLDIKEIKEEQTEHDDFVIDEDAGNQLLETAFAYAEDDKNDISHDVRKELYTSIKESEEAGSGDETGDEELDTFLMDHFGVYETDDIYSSNGELKTKYRKDIDGLVEDMVKEGVTDASAIVTLMGKLPPGNTRGQGEYIQALLTHIFQQMNLMMLCHSLSVNFLSLNKR